LGEGCTIVGLSGMVAALPAEDLERFSRLFRVSQSTGEMRVPESMRPWVEKQFGSVAAVESQSIVKVTNLATMEGALFNGLRACRPFEASDGADVAQIVAKCVGDPFCTPLTGTPEDMFGRVRGRHCMTASNVAKYDGFHGLVIFDEHDPLHLTEDAVADGFGTALEWAKKAHECDGQALYFFLMWNCLWKSGASIIHGHMQMALSRDMHYAHVEALRRAALAYRNEHAVSLFDDLFQAHRSLGLGWESDGIRSMAYLTPVKEKETILLADALDDRLARAVYGVLHCMVEQMGVRSFNVSVSMPPIGPTGEDWSGFPVMVRIVDRGDLNSRVADIGAMELYASSVIASDPFAVAEMLRVHSEAEGNEGEPQPVVAA
jgi:hypothetical protein